MARLFLVVAVLALFDSTTAVRRSGVVDEAGRQLYNLLHTNEHQGLSWPLPTSRA